MGPFVAGAIINAAADMHVETVAPREAFRPTMDENAAWIERLTSQRWHDLKSTADNHTAQFGVACQRTVAKTDEKVLTSRTVYATEWLGPRHTDSERPGVLAD